MDEKETQAGDAVINRLWTHTVGIVNGLKKVVQHADGSGYDEKLSGSGALIKWNDDFCIVTAAHVIEKTADDQIRFFFRPSGNLDRTPVDVAKQGGSLQHFSGGPIKIRDIHRDAQKDIAVIRIQPTQTKRFTFSEFHTFKRGWKDAKNREAIYAFGYPTSSAIQSVAPPINQKAQVINTLFGTVWSSTIVPKPDSLRDSVMANDPFNAKWHLLAPWKMADEKTQPHGFSGAGIWTVTPMVPDKFWTPKLKFAGICTFYYQGSKLERIVTGSVVNRFLKKSLG